ncbi:tyrosine-type recombinase/integrase [Bacteroides sp. 51]|uniref:tyrosine-type recombinase/integrase n=1 Tax=Bacteroides sp. 51 TaxID=2302938 RepID=UPI0013D05F6B|nr:tyrosine-type recombinase/integrase [Bacteroides sp. 51]NDV84330.1 hypothetical protein [Bacteroides sp. 51]
MEEQVFLNFDVRFNLRKKKDNKPSIVYAVVCFKGRQWKINSGVKVCPHHWNPSKQMALCGTGLTSLDIHNNSIANNKLKEILLASEEMKMYLCEHIEEIDNTYNILRNYINPKMKHKAMSKKEIHLLAALRKIVVKKDNTESSKRIDLGHINVFEKFLKEKKIPLILDNLNLDTIEDFQEYLVEKNKNQNTINQTTSKIIALAKLISSDREYRDAYDWHAKDIHKFVPLKSKLTKTQKKSKQVILTESEIEQLYAFDDLTDGEREARDLFILQCYVGQRIGDMEKVHTDSIIEQVDGMDVITINSQQKTNASAYIPLLPIAKEILEKYEGKLIKINWYNNNQLRRVGEKANLSRSVTYFEPLGKTIKEYTKPLYEMLHTHTARHTFITMMCRMGVPKDSVIIATGHTDTKMIDDVYLHFSPEDQKRKIVADVSRVLGGNATTAQPKLIPNDNKAVVVETIAESNDDKIFRENIDVMIFLGVPALDIKEADNVEKQYRIIIRYESKLLDMVDNEIDFQTIKRMFNQGEKSLRERHDELFALIEKLKQNKQGVN